MVVLAGLFILTVLVTISTFFILTLPAARGMLFKVSLSVICLLQFIAFAYLMNVHLLPRYDVHVSRATQVIIGGLIVLYALIMAVAFLLGAYVFPGHEKGLFVFLGAVSLALFIVAVLMYMHDLAVVAEESAAQAVHRPLVDLGHRVETLLRLVEDLRGSAGGLASEVDLLVKELDKIRQMTRLIGAALPSEGQRERVALLDRELEAQCAEVERALHDAAASLRDAASDDGTRRSRIRTLAEAMTRLERALNERERVLTA